MWAGEYRGRDDDKHPIGYSRACQIGAMILSNDRTAMTQPPPLSSHLPPPLPPSTGMMVLRFFIALLVGTGLSALAWIAGWETFNKGPNGGAMLLIIPGFKLLVSIILLIQRGWRSAGAGLLASIPIGATHKARIGGRRPGTAGRALAIPT